MKYKLEIHVEEHEIAFAEKFFKNISFVTAVKVIANNEITSPAILTSIDGYENGKATPTQLGLTELKAMVTKTSINFTIQN